MKYKGKAIRYCHAIYLGYGCAEFIFFKQFFMQITEIYLENARNTKNNRLPLYNFCSRVNEIYTKNNRLSFYNFCSREMKSIFPFLREMKFESQFLVERYLFHENNQFP